MSPPSSCAPGAGVRAPPAPPEPRDAVPGRLLDDPEAVGATRPARVQNECTESYSVIQSFIVMPTDSLKIISSPISSRLHSSENVSGAAPSLLILCFSSSSLFSKQKKTMLFVWIFSAKAHRRWTIEAPQRNMGATLDSQYFHSRALILYIGFALFQQKKPTGKFSVVFCFKVLDVTSRIIFLWRA